ncbi:hypothetical protein D3C75_866730 [compost metagenome]
MLVAVPDTAADFGVNGLALLDVAGALRTGSLTTGTGTGALRTVLVAVLASEVMVKTTM